MTSGWNKVPEPVQWSILAYLDIPTRGRLHRTSHAFYAMCKQPLTYPVHVDLRPAAMQTVGFPWLQLQYMLTSRTRSLWWASSWPSSWLACWGRFGWRALLHQLTGVTFVHATDQAACRLMMEHCHATVQHLELARVPAAPELFLWIKPTLTWRLHDFPLLYVHTLELELIPGGWDELDLAASVPNARHIILGTLDHDDDFDPSRPRVRFPPRMETLTCTASTTLDGFRKHDDAPLSTLKQVECCAGLDSVDSLLTITDDRHAITVVIRSDENQAKRLVAEFKDHPSLRCKTTSVSATHVVRCDEVCDSPPELCDLCE